MSSAAWEVRFSNSRQMPYFYNPQTAQSIWDAPDGLTDAQVRALPGAAQYLAGGDKSRSGGNNKVSVPEGQVRASHILAKHTKSRRPSSWRTEVITLTPDEARHEIETILTELAPFKADPNRLAQRFSEVAAQRSDCSSARKGGDLGVFGRGMMQGPFEHATYALQPGEMSGVVETDSGVHIILRTA